MTTSKKPGFDPNIQAMLEGERLAWLRTTWPVDVIDDLFKRATRDKGLAAELCERVASLVGLDNELVALLRKHISAERSGKQPIKKSKPDPRRYYGPLLTFYYMGRCSDLSKLDSRAYAAQVMRNGRHVKTDETIRNELVKAHRLLSVEDLDPGLHEIARQEWPSH